MEENKDFNSVNFLVFLWKWRKLFIIVFIATAILSAAASFLITPMYKSTVVMFPTSTNSISKALISQTSSGKDDILEFGEENQAEQMLQVLSSSKIRDEIVKRFDLFKHYKIDPKSKYKLTQLQKTYDDNIRFRRTEFLGVEILVMDSDPKMSADIANTIAELMDSTKNAMQKERAVKGFEIVKTSIANLRKDISEMEDRLIVLRKKGVHDYEKQAEMFNQELAVQIGSGNTAGAARLQQRLDTLALYGGSYVILKNELEFKAEQMVLLEAKYEEARVDAEEYIPQKFVVDHAFPAERKSYPVRWLVVAVSCISTMLLTLFALIMIENIKRIKPEEEEK